MTQKEKLEQLTGEKFPEPTKQPIQKWNIPNSPFWHVKNEEGHHLIMGKYKLNKIPFNTAEELHKWMNDDQWNIILSMQIAIATDILNNKTNN